MSDLSTNTQSKYSSDEIGNLAIEVIKILKFSKFYNRFPFIEDAVHDAVYNFLKKGDSINVESLKAFLLTSAKRKLISETRRIKPHRNYIQHQMKSSEVYFDPCNNMGELETELMKQLIYRTIDTLPLRCRRVIIAHLAGLSNEEIALRYNISCDTVRSHKSHAIENIMNILNTADHTSNATKLKPKM